MVRLINPIPDHVFDTLLKVSKEGISQQKEPLSVSCFQQDILSITGDSRLLTDSQNSAFVRMETAGIW